ncbi:MAG TPA: GNAT family N-acetyltransferase [Acidobacteriaceae bacterium]
MSAAELFRIRTAHAADIPALRCLIQASVLGLATHEYSPREVEGSLGSVLGLDTQLIADGTYFVAEAQSGAPTLAGCGGWSFRKTLCGSDHAPRREQALLDPAVDAARIRAIYVHPAWARQGLGTLLLSHCEEAARLAGFRHYEMGSTLTGVALYSLRGYQGRERVDIALHNGETLGVLRMVKSLDEPAASQETPGKSLNAHVAGPALSPKAGPCE